VVKSKRLARAKVGNADFRRDSITDLMREKDPGIAQRNIGQLPKQRLTQKRKGNAKEQEAQFQPRTHTVMYESLPSTTTGPDMRKQR